MLFLINGLRTRHICLFCAFAVLSGCELLPSCLTTPNSCVSALELSQLFQCVSFGSSDFNSYNE